jgi:hypothetical protein
MTREETKRDLHHLYGHWPDRMASKDSSMKAHRFYEWLKAMDTGILSYGNFGDGTIDQHIAVWIEEWENDRAAHRIEHESVTPAS